MRWYGRGVMCYSKPMQPSAGHRVLRNLIIFSGIAWILPATILIVSELISPRLGRVAWWLGDFLGLSIFYAGTLCALLSCLYLYIHIFKWGKEGYKFDTAVAAISILLLLSFIVLGSLI